MSHALGVIARLGPRGAARLARALWLDPVTARARSLGVRVYRRLKGATRGFQRSSELRRWRRAAPAVVAAGRERARADLRTLQLSEAQRSELTSRLERDGEALIATIDQDGYWDSTLGAIEGAPNLGDRDFLARKRFDVEVIATPGYWGVRKRYRGDRTAFLNELAALHRLADCGVRVPSVLAVDFNSPALVVSHLAGRVLREALAEAGAPIRDRDVELGGPLAADRHERVLAAGRESLHRVVDPGFVDALAADLRRIHQAGLLLRDVKWGNIVIGDDGRPGWIDFDLAEDHSELSWASFRVLADLDVERFNRAFGTELPTYARLRQALDSRSDPALREWYAPLYLGAGLRTGPLWNLGVGWGRWEYMLRDALPELAGKRVLDLGANNGHNALQMLRAGAGSAVGVELDQRWIAQGRFLKRALEWADGRDYDFEFRQADMRATPELELGRFDLVTALCCLYYLAEPEIETLVRALSTMSPLLVVQCNQHRDYDRADEDTYRKASLDFNVALLEGNGYPDVRVVAPRGYARPLVIGSRG